MEFKDVLRERLELEFTKRLFTMIPSTLNFIEIIYIEELIQTLKNVLTLKFDQEPDYVSIIASVRRALNNYITSKQI
jgi:hypothetical protein